MRDVIARIVDGSRFREFKKEYGTTIVTVSNQAKPTTKHLLTFYFLGLCEHPWLPRWYCRE